MHKMTPAVRTAATLLERERFVDALELAHDDARAGRGRVALLSGEAGGGKTALLRHFCDDRARSSRVLWGACDALFTPRPLGPILDIVPDVGSELRGLVQGDAVPFQVATALIRELRENGPTILVLEDVHWADEATLDVLRLLMRRIEQASVLLVASYRRDGVTAAHPLTLVLGETVNGPRALRLQLPPLSPAAVAELAEPHGVDPEALYGVTSGNPFFVTEVLAAQGPDIPEPVRDAVLARVARLSSEARAVLEAIAISTPQAELWLVEALSGPLDSRLDECLESGILDAGEAAVSFRHELARLAVEGSLTPARKLDLHRAALTALTSRGDVQSDLARLADHAEAAQDREAVLRFARAAGDHARSLSAHREAAEQYGRALRFDAGLAPDERAQLLRRRSRECYLTDQAEEAIDALREAAGAYRETGDRLREGETLSRLSGILWCPGRGDEARRTGL